MMKWEYSGVLVTTLAGQSIQFAFSVDGTINGSVYHSAPIALPNTGGAQYEWILKGTAFINNVADADSSEIRSTTEFTYAPAAGGATVTLINRTTNMNFDMTQVYEADVSPIGFMAKWVTPDPTNNISAFNGVWSS